LLVLQKPGKQLCSNQNVIQLYIVYFIVNNGEQWSINSFILKKKETEEQGWRYGSSGRALQV
jgi:hypothetical protein